MKPITLCALAALALGATACIGTSNERHHERAFQACKHHTDENTRQTCRETESARLQADERDELTPIGKSESDAERRQAELEALGVPEGARKSSYVPFLKGPNR